MMEQARYNPRYLAYAAEHSRTAEEQLANDREEWPGGLMCGFILWNTARIAEYRSEEHTSELQSLMRISYAVFCLKKKKNTTDVPNRTHWLMHNNHINVT